MKPRTGWKNSDWPRSLLPISFTYAHAFGISKNWKSRIVKFGAEFPKMAEKSEYCGNTEFLGTKSIATLLLATHSAFVVVSYATWLDLCGLTCFVLVMFILLRYEKSRNVLTSFIQNIKYMVHDSKKLEEIRKLLQMF